MTHEEMALTLIAAGWRVMPPLAQETCRHPRAQGAGTVRDDGSGYSDFRCPDCGVHQHMEYPPRQSGLSLGEHMAIG